MKILFLMIILFVLGFIQGEFIKKGQWLIEEILPNHWIGHSVWGIFWVNTLALIFGIIDFYQWCVLFLLFSSALPGIYQAGIKQWHKCNLGKEILSQLKIIYQSLI